MRSTRVGKTMWLAVCVFTLLIALSAFCAPSAEGAAADGTTTQPAADKFTAEAKTKNFVPGHDYLDDVTVTAKTASGVPVKDVEFDVVVREGDARVYSSENTVDTKLPPMKTGADGTKKFSIIVGTSPAFKILVVPRDANKVPEIAKTVVMDVKTAAPDATVNQPVAEKVKTSFKTNTFNFKTDYPDDLTINATDKAGAVAEGVIFDVSVIEGDAQIYSADKGKKKSLSGLKTDKNGDIKVSITTGESMMSKLRIIPYDDKNHPQDTKLPDLPIVVATDLAIDSRYKIWLYTGYTYLRTKNDFKDGYPELLARFETRLFDNAIYLEQTNHDKFDRMRKHECLPTDNCGWFPHFSVGRLYGETGLTGTTVASTSTTTTPGTTTTITAVKQAFTGSFGVGYGWTLPVTTRPAAPGEVGETNAFTILGVSRLGITTVPGVEEDKTNHIAAKQGATAFSWSTGIRIENANLLRTKGGNFEGAYFEIGFGENEQFARKKVPRLRVDGLVPLPAGGDLVRFALRLQLDTARPFHPKENVESGGEIRISGLFNIDLKELAKRFGGK